MLAFSTSNTTSVGQANQQLSTPTAWNGALLNALFEATVQATEETLVNCLVAAVTMTGANNLTVHAIPHDRLRNILKRYNRLIENQ